MSETESQHEQQEKANLAEEIREYAEKKVELFTLSWAENISHAIARSVQRMLGLMLLGSALFFGWFALAFYLAERTGSEPAGFSLAALPLLIISILFIKWRSGRLTELIQAEIMQSLLQKNDEEANRMDDRDEER